MKFFALPVVVLAGMMAFAPLAQAAPRQYVVVVAEGLSPQMFDLGQSYIRKADEAPDSESAFATVAKTGMAAPTTGNVLNEMKGLLETAHNAGFKTGLITTGDLSTEAPLWYNVAGDALGSAAAHYDFLGGGGRANLADAGEAVSESGGTYIDSTDGLVREIKGRVLAPQADGDMSYALDRDPEKEGGISELATMAMDTLGDNETPFVLVIHDTLIQKALQAKDTPALFEEFRELNSILDDVMTRRDDNEDLSVTALSLGSAFAPRFAPDADTDSIYNTISILGRSYQGVGTLLQDGKADTLNDLIDPESGEYRDWKLNDADKKRILSGTLSGETAVRAFYEPLLKLQIVPQTSAPTAYSVGLDIKDGLVPALKRAFSTPAK